MGGTVRNVWFWVAAILIVALTSTLIWASVVIGDLRRDVDDARRELAAAGRQNSATSTELRAVTKAFREQRSRERELLRLVRNSQTCASKSARPYGGPHVVPVPDHGPPGTRVTLVGDCFLDRDWNAGYGIFLIAALPDGCELIAGADPFRLTVDKNGRATGYFTVPSVGGCFQTDRTRGVAPGEYEIGIGCHACGTSRFRVTAS